MNNLKIIMLCSILFLVSIYSNNLSFVYADSSSEYLRIVSSNTFLYRTANIDENYENLYFELPQTYFVKLIDSSNENFYKVEYSNLIGYVKKSEVIKVNGTPQQPYLNNVTFKLNGTANAVLFSQPNNTSKYIGTIPFNAENILFWGKITGQNALPNLGNEWYYCTYTSFEQGIISGYIYAPLTTLVSNIPENNENLSESTPANSTPIQEILAPEIQKPSNIIIISILVIFALLILILLFKPNKKAKKAKLYNNSNLLPQNQEQFLEFNDKDNF